MTRYFLHVEADGQWFEDEEGIELASIEAAQRIGLKAAAQITADDLATGVERVSQRVIVADRNGTQLLEVEVEAAVRVHARKG